MEKGEPYLVLKVLYILGQVFHLVLFKKATCKQNLNEICTNLITGNPDFFVVWWNWGDERMW